ncbi:PIG-L deacetylase family protein [Lachnospiraceae bacterium 45-P1]
MNVLVFAPHNDDEILGVGGTICKLAKQGHSISVCEVTSGPKYKMMQEEARKAHAILGVKESVFLNLPYVRLKSLETVEINKAIWDVVYRMQPDVVFTPFIGDMHLDHREVTESVLVAVRPINNCSVKTVYMYETLSETGWNIPNAERSFMPDTWFDISPFLDEKIRAMQSYQSQIRNYPNPRSSEGIRALAMYRGSTVGVEYAECFMTVRNIVI